MRGHLIWSGKVGTCDVSKISYDYSCFLQVHLDYLSVMNVYICYAGVRDILTVYMRYTCVRVMLTVYKPVKQFSSSGWNHWSGGRR